jgi:lysozyme
VSIFGTISTQLGRREPGSIAPESPLGVIANATGRPVWPRVAFLGWLLRFARSPLAAELASDAVELLLQPSDDAQPLSSADVKHIYGQIDAATHPPELPPMQTVTALGLASIKSREGLRLVAYQDKGGVWTIGWGDTIRVKQGDTCTKEQADQRFIERVDEHQDSLRKALKIPCTQGQFDALVSMSYNIGAPALRGSTLMRLLNGGNTLGAASQFARWVHVKGVIDGVLVQRRVDELIRFLT